MLIKGLLRGSLLGCALAPLGLAQTDCAAQVEAIRRAPDAQHRLELVDQFLRTTPPNESTNWAYQQKFGAEVEMARLDEALETATALLARDQRQVEVAYQSLEIARKKGDPALVKKWSDIASASAAWYAKVPVDTILGGAANQKQLTDGDRRTVELLTDMIKHAPDGGARLKLLNVFVTTLPPNESTTWAYTELFRTHLEGGQRERALEIADALMTRDDGALEVAYKCLEIAVEKGDPALIRKWSDLADKAAARVLASAGEDEAMRKYAGQVRAYLAYLSYRDMLATNDVSKRLAMSDEFLKKNPTAEYRHAVEGLYLAAIRQSRDNRKLVAAAERVLGMDATNEDALLIVAQASVDSQGDAAKTAAYASRLLAAVERPEKPVELSDEEWSKKRSRLAGNAYWLMGHAAIDQQRYSDADKLLRQALPRVKGDAQLTSAALFYLGWADYQLKNYPDALRFNQQCVTLKGPYQEQATRNLQVIRAEMGGK